MNENRTRRCAFRTLGMHSIFSACALLAFATVVVAAELPNDKRLDKPVTLGVKGEALSDVVKMLQDKTQVRLEASSEVADQKVTIFLDNKPLREVMEGLVTVFRYQWTVPTTGQGVYRITEPQQVRNDRKILRQRASEIAWGEWETMIKRRAALEVNSSELNAEMRRLRSMANDSKGKVQGERDPMLRKRDTPVDAAMCGDLAISRLYCHLSTPAWAALKAGAHLRFDSQSSEPAWKLPADVLEYLGTFVETSELMEPRFHRQSASSQWPPDRCEYAVTLTATVSDEVVLRSNVLVRNPVSEAGQDSAKYLNVIASGHLDLGEADDLFRKVGDKVLDQNVTFSGPEIGVEANTNAWAWPPFYYATSSDMLALIHRKLGLQIIAAHYTDYDTRDVSVDATRPLKWWLSMWGANGWDGKYIYKREVDVWDAQAQEVPNRLLRAWQAAYTRRGYLNLDELAQVAWSKFVRRHARMLGLDSIDYFQGWVDSLEAPCLKLYGSLFPTQREEAFDSGIPVAAFTSEQRSLLAEILGKNSVYMWRERMTSGSTGKIVVGIYNQAWQRIDGTDDPADAVVESENVLSTSEPVTLTICKRQGQAHYYWFSELSSPWPQHPTRIANATNKDEALRQVRTGRPNATLANIKLIESIEYVFAVTYADGNKVERVVRVPLAPVTLTDSGTR